MPALKILFVVSELAPMVKTGGLGDVAAALPPQLRAAGHDVRLLLPAYPALRDAFPDAVPEAHLASPGGLLAGAQLLRAQTAAGVPLYLLDCPAYFARAGNPYLGPEGLDWTDNVLRFGLLGRIAALLASAHSPLSWRPDILHCHDWQSALAPACLHYLDSDGAAASVLTVHNLAFQGLFARETLAQLGLPAHAWAMDGVEYHGHLSFLKAGLQFADQITTVSPTYAREIQTPEQGMGMDGLLRYRAADLSGSVNGIDTAVWDPATDPHLARRYSVGRLADKTVNRAALQRELGLDTACGGPLVGVISRFTAQKGLDLLPPIAAALAALPVQLVVLGSGERELAASLVGMARAHPRQFVVQVGFDEALAHRIEAAADLFLMPSRFEPCGLNQRYSQRYGTLPVVRATGGLADTVIDIADEARGNGIVFQEASSAALLAAVRRACTLFSDAPAFAAVQRRAMALDFSWTQTSRALEAVYRRALTRRAAAQRGAGTFAASSATAGGTGS